MRIHLAENLTNSYYWDILKSCTVENILFSYATANIKLVDKKLDHIKTKNIIVDSGAFSAWTKKQHINIDKYIEFCKSFKHRPENIYFVNLDKIPGDFGRKPTKNEIEESAQIGWNNMLYMENHGIKVIHVFHQHEDFKWLDKLVEHQEYIGISPANDVTKQVRMLWLNKVFSRIKASRKTHGFGATAKEIVLGYPWYSVDSTSWKSPARFASSSTINLKKLGFKKNEKTPGIFMKYQLTDEIKRWQKLEKEATQLWQNRGITWKK